MDLTKCKWVREERGGHGRIALESPAAPAPRCWSPRNEPKKTPRVFGMTITVRAYEGGREDIEGFAKVHRWILSWLFFNLWRHICAP